MSSGNGVLAGFMRQRYGNGNASSGDELENGVPAGYGRQRHSNGYASSGDELEEGGTPRTPRTPTFLVAVKPKTWTEIVENVIWIASALFIIYLGDQNSNLIRLLCLDDRIKRWPLYLGFVSICFVTGIILYAILFMRDVRKADDKKLLIPPSAAPIVALAGMLSFFLFSLALWPIWSFLTLPLLITLYMAFMVVLQFLLFGMWKADVYTFRTD